MIRICTHAYAEVLPQYAVFLRAQLSSLVLHPPKVDWSITVCRCPEDTRVTNILRQFKPLLGEKLQWLTMPKAELFRRSIGRNEIALRCSPDDIFWGTDVDHTFGESCLDTLQSIWDNFGRARPVMVWPDQIMIHRDHDLADQWWADAVGMCDTVLPIQPSDFVIKKYRRAIGGVHIIGGDFASRYGYLNKNRRWQRPVSPDKPFADFRDDIAERRFCQANGVVVSIRLPNLFRLRHQATTYKG